MSYCVAEFDNKVIELLRTSGIGFMPSDTIYGLSASALNKQAVGRIYELKKRDSNKPFVILISKSEQAALLNIDKKELEPALKYWPAPLTLICDAPTSPEYLHRGMKSLALRIPDNKELLGLIDKVGPIVSTSANLQSEEAAKSVDEAKILFGSELDFYVDIGELSGKPSTIVKNADGKLKVTRRGVFDINT